MAELEKFLVVRDYTGDLELKFSTKFFKIKRPKYTLAQARKRDATYSIRLYVLATLTYIKNAEKKRRIEQ